jgi:uncharacterized membrane protein YfcA
MEHLTLALAGALSGLVAGIAGLGGGIVIVPLLVALYGQSALHDAVVASWFAVLFNSAAAAWRQWRLRTPHERAALLAASKPFLAGVIVVTPAVAAAVAQRPSWITPSMVGGLQLTLAAALAWRPAESAAPRSIPHAIAAAWGALVGAASTLIGIGGGAYTTAYMVYGPRRPLRDAIAAGNVTGLAVGALCVAGWLASRLIGAGAAAVAPASPITGTGMAWMLACGVAASTLGVKLSRRLPATTLKKILVGLLAVSAIHLLLS